MCALYLLHSLAHHISCDFNCYNQIWCRVRHKSLTTKIGIETEFQRYILSSGRCLIWWTCTGMAVTLTHYEHTLLIDTRLREDFGEKSGDLTGQRTRCFVENIAVNFESLIHLNPTTVGYQQASKLVFHTNVLPNIYVYLPLKSRRFPEITKWRETFEKHWTEKKTVDKLEREKQSRVFKNVASWRGIYSEEGLRGLRRLWQWRRPPGGWKL